MLFNNSIRKDDQLVGTFKEGRDTGTFTFTLSTDSEGIISFVGEYKYAGSNEENYWDGQKISDDFGTVGTEWGGVWFTHTMVLYQVGSQATGVYMSSGSLYQFSGSITGSTFAGRLNEGDGYQGDIRFVMTKAGRVIFNGEWRYDESEDWYEWDGFKAK